MIALAILITGVYLIFAIGTITLIRYQEKNIPKPAGLFWPILLFISAAGGFDD